MTHPAVKSAKFSKSKKVRHKRTRVIVAVLLVRATPRMIYKKVRIAPRMNNK